LFGYDVTQEGVLDRITKEFGDEVRTIIESEWAEFESQQKAASEQQKPVEPALPTAAPAMPRIEDLILERLKQAGDVGSKAAPIRAFIEKTIGREIHDKTVGMTLYRMSNKGLVRRGGHTWFFVPQPAEKESPGELPPGLKELIG